MRERRERERERERESLSKHEREKEAIKMVLPLCVYVCETALGEQANAFRFDSFSAALP